MTRTEPKRALALLALLGVAAACGPTTKSTTADPITADHPDDSAKRTPVEPDSRGTTDTEGNGGATGTPSPNALPANGAPAATPSASASAPTPVVPAPAAPAAAPAAPAAAPAAAAAAPSPLPAAARPGLRGTNLIGMEGGFGFNQATGPVPGVDYPVHSTQVIDYLAGKHVNVIRFLFSWERMQSTLNGPIPAATSGNYKAYFDDYKRIVDYATNVKNMVVIMEPWQASASGGVGGASWRGNVVGSGVVADAHFADFWSKMAAVYASNPRIAIGLVNEPNNTSTMTWFATAQAAITAIRGAGFAGDIHVPGNGWTGAGNWTDSWYDTGSPQRSNAYGWMNARGVGQPLLDPLGKLVASVHTYADSDAGGSTADVVSGTISRERVKVAVDWARANQLQVFIGEIGMYAGATNASANWNDFIGYANANADALIGFAWWGCGAPGWWNDVAASGGGHFSITPTNGTSGDTVNMTMIQSSFLQ
jgi:endoglucanase